jgi:CRISPR-associated protein Cas5 subtype I-A
MKFSVIYQPTNLFSLKESNSTNSGAKSLLIPSPYSIKMALFNQAITIDGLDKLKEDKKSKEFVFIKDARISYRISGSFCVNNCFVKVLKIKTDKRNKQQREEGVNFEPGLKTTVSFREYIYLSDNIEIIFDVISDEAKQYLQKYLHRINYFGKRGCFFQFVGYRDNPSEPNVKEFDVDDFSPGILQEYDDISPKADFKNVDNFDSANAKRDKKILVIPVENINSSKSYTHFRCY